MSDKKLPDDRRILADDGSQFTVKELKRFLKKEKIVPSDLFDKFDILEDPMMKEAVNEKADFELEFRDQEAQREIEKMEKENKENEDELSDVDLLPEGDAPAGPEKKQEKKGESKEDKDLLPPGGESTEDTEDDEGDKENGGLLPG